MIRNEQKSIIFLINNGGYTIEVEIHDGPYNVIKNWNYTALVDAIHNGEGKCWTTKVKFLYIQQQQLCKLQSYSYTYSCIVLKSSLLQKLLIHTCLISGHMWRGTYWSNWDSNRRQERLLMLHWGDCSQGWYQQRIAWMGL